MSNKQQEETKEVIEVYLLTALKDIDGAVYHIGQALPDGCDVYGNEISKLLECKRDIKRILNQHFDWLARQKQTA